MYTKHSFLQNIENYIPFQIQLEQQPESEDFVLHSVLRNNLRNEFLLDNLLLLYLENHA